MAIFDELKSIGKTLRQADKIEQYQQILDIQKKLLEMQKKIAELENENKELKEELKLKEDLIFERNAYWIKKESSEKDGPFCSVCWDSDRKLIRLRKGNYAHGWAICPKCDKLVPRDGI